MLGPCVALVVHLEVGDDSGRRCFGNCPHGGMTMADNLKISGAAPDEKLDRKLLEKAMTITPGCMYVFDIKERINIYANQAARNDIGYTEEELGAMGSRLLSTLMHPADLPRFEAHLARLDVAADDDILEFEYRMRHKAGGWRWFRSRDAVFGRSAAGQPVSIIGVASDITELKDQEHLRRVLDSLFTFVGVMTPDGTLIEANQAPLEAGGLSPEEVLGKPFWDTYWFNHSPQVQEQLKQAIDRANHGEASRYDVDVRMAGGVLMTIDFMLVPLRDETGKIQFLIPSAVDISERKRAEEVLRKQNERLRLLWESAGILFSTDDSAAMIEGLYEKISDHLKIDTCFQLHGQRTGRLAASSVRCRCIGRRRRIAVAAEVRPGHLRRSSRKPAGRSPPPSSSRETIPEPRSLKDLGVRSFVCNPLIANGQLLGTLSFGSRSRDRFDDDEIEFIETVTNYVTVAYERMRLLSQLHERDRRKDEFLAMLAHELRNPLAPIRNAVQYLRLKDLHEKDIAWAREMIDRQVNNLVRLIDDLLEISRITRGKIKLHTQETSLSAILSHAVEAMQPAIAEKRHVLSLDISAEPLTVHGDPTRLEQIIRQPDCQCHQVHRRAGNDQRDRPARGGQGDCPGSRQWNRHTAGDAPSDLRAFHAGRTIA